MKIRRRRYPRKTRVGEKIGNTRVASRSSRANFLLVTRTKMTLLHTLEMITAVIVVATLEWVYRDYDKPVIFSFFLIILFFLYFPICLRGPDLTRLVGLFTATRSTAGGKGSSLHAYIIDRTARAYTRAASS